MNKFALIWKTPDLRNKILITIGLLILTRVLAHVPIPALNIPALRTFVNSNQALGILDIFSGGGLSTLSLAMLGVGPYITASIIVQLLTIIIPSWQEMQKEGGEAGRETLNQYTRYLTVPLALLQAFGFILTLQRGSGGAHLLSAFTPFQWLTTLIVVAAATMVLMWLGELITEYGIGNGISLIIFAGIIARLPSAFQQGILANTTGGFGQFLSNPLTLMYIAIALITIAGVVLVTEAQRNIPVSYAKRVQGNKTYGGVNTHLPLRVNQAGVIPIIFALSILVFPPYIASYFTAARSAHLANFAVQVQNFFQQTRNSYAIMYFVLVFVFTYLYTSIVFNPDEISENVQKNGGFIPGLRPGRQTAEYLYKVMNRITSFGALFLGVIAILPFILSHFVTKQQNLTIGGTALLIVVAVIIETIKAVEAQMVMHHYE